jgi:hypothetical protein
MRYWIFIFSLILLYGCGQNSQTASTQSNIDSLKSNSASIPEACIPGDTITGMGTKIHYAEHSRKLQITYGDDTFSRTLDSLYTCEYDTSSGLWDFIPKFHAETKNHLIFTNILWTSGGGNPAPLEFYAIIAPKNNTDSIFEKEFFIDCEGDYLLYGDEENENIHLMNLETKRIQTLKLNPRPDFSRSPTLSILNTEINKRTLYIKYESTGQSDETKIIEKNFTIKI